MENLDVGNMLLLSFSGMEDRLTGILVGKKVGDGLMIYANVPEETQKRLKKNNSVLVQFAHESTLLGFHSQVSPDHNGDCIFHLSWPQAVEEMDRRACPRVTCHFPGRLRKDDVEQPCLVEDLGERGVRIRIHGAEAEEFRQSLKPGDSLVMDFAPFGPDPLYKADCTVLKSFRSGRKPYVVLLLDHVDQEFKALIHHHIDRVLEESN